MRWMPAITLLWLVLSAEGLPYDPRYRFLAMAVSRSILRCVHRRRSGPVVVSRSVMLSSFMGAPEPTAAKRGGLLKVPTDLGRFSSARDWPLLSAPRERIAQKINARISGCVTCQVTTRGGLS
jgi:hypothetical protein